MTILNTFIEPAIVWSDVLAYITCVIVLGVVAWLVTHGDKRGLIIGVVIGIFIFGGLATLQMNKEPTEEIEVTIDDSVGFNEIHSQYYVVEQRDNIWVLVPRR